MNDEEDVGVRVRTALDQAPPGSPPGLEGVRRRARTLRGWRYATGAVGVAVAAAAVLAPLAILSSLARHPSLGHRTGLGSSLPDMAQVVCSDSGTQLLTPAVRPQPDGVHFSADNQTGKNVSFEVTYPSGGAGGANAPPGVSTPLDPGSDSSGWAAPPGPVTVDCLDVLGGSGGSVPRTHPVTLQVVDEGGLWVSTSLDCSRVTENVRDYPSPIGDAGDPVDLARAHFRGLKPGDKVDRAGYPRSTNETVRVARDQAVIAVAEYHPASPGRWLLLFARFCSDSGLSG